MYIICFQIAAVLTSPFDVIKTHRQIELGEIVFASKNGMCYEFAIYQITFIVHQLHLVS
mgnify:CR=1 FL=1